jgi:uncharacterized SAM-binding protein YcdF (DUF218 family)
VSNLFSLLGIESWKPVLTALLLPPVPLLLLVLAGARLLLPRRGLGWLLVLLGTLGIWLSACAGIGDLLTRALLHPPPALSGPQIAQLRSDMKTRQAVAIVVLGAGRDGNAPEYGSSNLTSQSLERLHFGLWLGRETGVPVAFSGGVGWGDTGATTEADVAERIAARDFGLPLKWLEDQSRDTRENALRSVALLKRAGVKRIILVTHGWHMPRALRLFESAAAGEIEILPAPMGLAPIAHGRALDWLPSTEGFARVRQVLREWLGRLAED